MNPDHIGALLLLALALTLLFVSVRSEARAEARDPEVIEVPEDTTREELRGLLNWAIASQRTLYVSVPDLDTYEQDSLTVIDMAHAAGYTAHLTPAGHPSRRDFTATFTRHEPYVGGGMDNG